MGGPLRNCPNVPTRSLKQNAAYPSYALGGGLPRVVTAAGWERLGVDTRVSHEFAAGPLDFRGAASGSGA